MNNYEQNNPVAVRNLQRYLRQLAYHDPKIPMPPVDGVFESQTREALEAFQRLYGLPVTGVADQVTWDTLYAAYRASVAEYSPPECVSIFPRYPVGYELRPGESGFPVLTLQFMLRELRVSYGITLPVELTGSFDEDTEDAVRGFQAKNFLPATGRVGKLTWDLITDQFNLL